MSRVRTWTRVIRLAACLALLGFSHVCGQQTLSDLPIMDMAHPVTGREEAYREMVMAGADGKAQVLKWARKLLQTLLWYYHFDDYEWGDIGPEFLGYYLHKFCSNDSTTF